MGSTTNLRENKTLFIPCDCRSEILMIEYDHEMRMADLAIFEHWTTFRSKMSLWQRLRYCWRVVWHKKPYADAMVLNTEQLLDLKTFLSGLDLQ